jgi:hypothetical protein
MRRVETLSYELELRRSVATDPGCFDPTVTLRSLVAAAWRADHDLGATGSRATAALHVGPNGAQLVVQVTEDVEPIARA